MMMLIEGFYAKATYKDCKGYNICSHFTINASFNQIILDCKKTKQTNNQKKKKETDTHTLSLKQYY